MRNTRKIGAARILLLSFLFLVLAESRAIAICTLVGPPYRFASETVDWSMRIFGGENCVRDFNLSGALPSSPDKLKVENLRVVALPEQGHVAIQGSKLSYISSHEFHGNDSFILEVSGVIDGVHGISKIRISISDSDRHAVSRDAVVPKHLSRTIRGRTALSPTPKFTSFPGSEWSALKVGAGGYVTGASIASDNTFVVRTDTYGAYIWDPSATTPCGNTGCRGAFRQLVTADSMPIDFVAVGQLYNYGVYEIAISSSNSDYIYMIYYAAQPGVNRPNAQIYQSTDKGRTWRATNFTSTVTVPYGAGQVLDANGPTRGYGQKLVVDPNTPTTVFASGGTSLWKTTDGGGTWKKLIGFPSPSGNPFITGLAINPSDSNEIFGASGGNGIYHSTDGGNTWTRIATGTGPSEVTFAVATSNGVYFACDNSANPNLWVWANSIWREVIRGTGWGSSCKGIAVNPNDQNWIRVVSAQGTIAETTTGGTNTGAWSAFSDNSKSPTFDNGPIPWLSHLSVSVGWGLWWDQTNPSTGKMLFTTAIGVYTATVAQGITSSTATTDVPQSVGIEQLVATQVIVPPTGARATPITCSWDFGVHAPDLKQYPSTYYPTTGALAGCWGVDYASSDPSTFVVIGDGGYIAGSTSISSTCNVEGTCTLFSSIGSGLPANAFPNNPCHVGGNIAASTPDNILFAPGSLGQPGASGCSGNGTAPYYTTNGGKTWKEVSISGISNWDNFRMNPFSVKPQHLICADRVSSATFYLLLPRSGLYYSSNGGASWSLSTGAISPGSPAQMHCTPSQAGDLWIATGPDGNPGFQPAGGDLYHVTNANSSSARVTKCSHVVEPYDVGIGTPKPGNTYPTIYIVGWVGWTPTWGIWRSDDQCSTWTQLDTWPAGSMDQVTTITGDPNSWNRLYIGFTGSGYAWRQY